MLPPLASLDELSDRIDGGIPAGQENRAAAALKDASNLVRAKAGKEWPMESGLDEESGEENEPPDLIVTITIQVAKRAFLNPDGLRSQAIDGYTTSIASPHIYLTKDEIRQVRSAAGRSGIGSVDMEGVLPIPESERFLHRDILLDEAP